MKVKDAVNFFRAEFGKFNEKKLNEYIYLVEHMYGLKGKKTDYTPWGCEKMAQQHAPGNFFFITKKALETVMGVHSLITVTAS